MRVSEEITFGLVHGSWHAACCWDECHRELGEIGHNPVTMDLPIDDPDANFEDYADVVADALLGAENVVLVGHSRGGNVIPRVASRIAVRQMVFLSATFEFSTIGRPWPEEKASMPARNTAAFKRGIVNLGNGLTEYDPQIARDVFYNDCSDEQKELAVSRLRPQYRYVQHPRLETWPEVPHDYVLCSQDLAVRPEWSRYASRQWLGYEPVVFESGHSPFISKPKELAHFLLSIVR